MTTLESPPISTVSQPPHETHVRLADGGPSPHPAEDASKPNGPTPGGPILFDPFLDLAVAVLDDTETVWIANNNRLSIMIRPGSLTDVKERGWGLTMEHPDVAMLATLVANLKAGVEQATKNLEKRMKKHPLGPWVKAQKGLGPKQTARLLGAIGDPYWNILHDRPRTVSELWSYCGFAPVDGVARRRTKGVKSNWSEDARKRAWLITSSVIKTGAGGPYRKVYDDTKARYADAVHNSPCIRCGPAKNPAPAGSPLSKGHIDGRGRRAIAKEVLKDLWIESKRLHELQASDQSGNEPHGSLVAGLINP